MTAPSTADVVVIGAGITGLTCAHDLLLRGVRPLVLEASGRSGGLIKTDHLNGFTIETGPDALLAQKRAALDLCETLGLRSSLIAMKRPRGAFVVTGVHLHRIPAPSLLGIPSTWSALARYDLLPWAARTRLACEAAIPARRSTEDESVASFFSRRFGPATVSLIAQPLLGGIHSGDIAQLSMQSLFPRLVDAERRYGSVLKSLHKTFARVPPDDAGPFRSLAGGLSELVGALLLRLPAETVQYDAPAELLRRDGDRWSIRAAGLDIRARAVVVAAPAFVGASLLGAVDPDAAALCDGVQYVSTAGVVLGWPRRAIPHPLAGSGFVVAREVSPLRITACTWISSKWPQRAPAGHELLRVFVGGAHDPGAIDLSDEELIALARTDLGRVLGVQDEPALARVYRWRRGSAQHHVGQLARMTALDARLAGLGGIFVAGSGFRAVGIPDCIADARHAAKAAADFLQR